MLKLCKEIESVKLSVLQAYIFTYLFVVVPSLFMKEDDDPFFFGKWVIGFRNGREAGGFFARHPFFLFDS